MEDRSQTDENLKAMLNSPARFTPAVPTPDWSTPVNTMNSNLILGNPSNSNMTCSVGDPLTTITLQNCMGTVDLKTTLDLATINARTRNSEYNPARFHGVVMRLRDPRTTALIFRSGKIVCTGARNEYDCLLASKKFAKIMHRIGFNVKFVNFKVQNLVATCDLRFPIKLENLNMVHGQFSSYEPEVFPGVVYRLLKPKLVMLIFVNGKIVFTGAKSREDIKEAFDNMYPILKSFKKN